MFIRNDQMPRSLLAKMFMLRAASFVIDLIAFVACAVIMGLVVGRPDPTAGVSDQYGSLALFYGGLFLLWYLIRWPIKSLFERVRIRWLYSLAQKLRPSIDGGPVKPGI
jgi:ABC-type transport system involved in multi-copper enzyme maturation permease subunit